MIFKRKIYDKILEWKNSPVHNSALLIEGARRIGKSTVVEEFAKREFPNNYIIVDFRVEPESVKKLFNNIKDLDAFFREFFLSQNKVIKNGGLIVFDEVQFCPKAREAIKDFVKDGRFYFIETGSLISIKENTKDIMIPSEEKRIEMYPMDFEEYLWAVEDNNAFSLLEDSFNSCSVSRSTHELYLQKFRSYMAIGGMPKVLSILLESNSFKLANDEKLDILKLYRDDLRKHDEKYGTICGMIFDAIPSQLAKTSRRFVISSVKSKKRYEQIERSLSDLCDFKIINKVNDISSLEMPISLQAKEDSFKLYFCDIGLLFSSLIVLSHEKMNEGYFKFIKGDSGANLGALFESVAIQQLINEGYRPYYHKYNLTDSNTAKTKTYELDIVSEINFKVVAMEIKSSKNYTTSSLDHIKDKYPQLKISKFVFGIKNLSREDNKITAPIYMMQFLK